jgi:hypothetical protein
MAARIDGRSIAALPVGSERSGDKDSWTASIGALANDKGFTAVKPARGRDRSARR